MNTTQCPECLSTNISDQDKDGSIDCLDCGIFWDAAHPNNQPGAPLFGTPLLDGPPAPLVCAVCDCDHSTDPTLVIARWRDQDICTNCLEERPGKEEAEAEARGVTPVMTQQEYRDKGGSCCPRCGSYDLTGGSFDTDEGIVSQRCTCHDCDLAWTDYYRLAGYVREEATETNDDWGAFLNTTILETITH